MDFLLHFGPSHYLDLFRGPAPYFSRQGNHSLRAFMEKYLEYARQAGDTGMICIPSGNHDMDRMARHLSQDEMKLAFLFLMTMPGVPFLYYGDEIGLRYLENLKSKEGGYQRTGARTPMQWDHTTNAGFSQAAPHKLYLPVDTSSDRPTVEEQEADPDSLLHTVRTLIHLRLQEAALGNRAGFELVSDALPLVYKRGTDAGKVIVILNPSMEPICWNARGTLLYQQGDVEPDGHDGWRLESGAGCILRVL
jgi:maltose alpha-D-glucosyltransferase/alpha-amylase